VQYLRQQQKSEEALAHPEERPRRALVTVVSAQLQEKEQQRGEWDVHTSMQKVRCSSLATGCPEIEACFRAR